MGTGVSVRTSTAAVQASKTPSTPPVPEAWMTRTGVREDIAVARPDAFADADFAGALGDYGQHDVHDDDSADHHEHAHDGDGHGGDGAGE